METQENTTLALIEEIDIDTLKAYFSEIMTDVVVTYGDDEQEGA